MFFVYLAQPLVAQVSRPAPVCLWDHHLRQQNHNPPLLGSGTGPTGPAARGRHVPVPGGAAGRHLQTGKSDSFLFCVKDIQYLKQRSMSRIILPSASSLSSVSSITTRGSTPKLGCWTCWWTLTDHLWGNRHNPADESWLDPQPDGSVRPSCLMYTVVFCGFLFLF